MKTQLASIKPATYKRFTVGQVYTSKIDLKDELGNTVPVGSKLRLIAIAAKVRMMPKSETTDGQPYFYNATLADNENDFPRVRANFCTLK